jgi:tRNA(Ile)-lysidine synthase TilS/MesJ
VSIITGADGPLPRVKPFKYTYEKEIVMYAYHKKLDYFSTECVYAPFAARGFARDFVKDLEVSVCMWRGRGGMGAAGYRDFGSGCYVRRGEAGGLQGTGT